MKRNELLFHSFPFPKSNRRLSDEMNSETKNVGGISEIKSETEKETIMGSADDSSFSFC